MRQPTAVRRRQFLRRAAAGVLIVRPWVVGRGAEPPPSERIHIAAIGAGGQDHSGIKGMVAGHEIVALCDADLSHAAAAIKEHPNARRYTDFRRMYDEMSGSIDAVLVATTDHTHFPAALWAIRRGKHVHVQKPLTHSMWEARQLAIEARRHKVVTKMGNRGQTSE